MSVRELLERMTLEDWAREAAFEARMNEECARRERETGNPTFWDYSGGIYELAPVEDDDDDE